MTSISRVTDNVSPLDWALRYAADGYPVFPVYPIDEPAPPEVVARFKAGGLSKKEAQKHALCGCGFNPCRSPGKHPITPNGADAATTDPERIRAWWERTPGANVGIRMPPGMVALDFDTYEAGVAERLAEFRKSAPNTLEQSSGAGGVHVLFTGVPEDHQFATTLDGQHGVDLIHSGHRYIVAEPSNHWTGGRYEWASAHDPAPAPAALLARCKRGVKPARTPSSRSTPVAGRYSSFSPAKPPGELQCPANVDPEVWAVQLAKTLLPPAIADGEPGSTEHGHVTLKRTAGHLIAGLGLDEEQALWILWEHYNPRCVPPWEEGADGTDGDDDFERTVRGAGAGLDPGYLLKNIPVGTGAVAAPATILERLKARTDERPQALATGLDPFDRQLTFGGIPVTKRVVIGGAPDAGKTSLALQWAEHMASKGAAVAWVAVDEDVDDLDTRRVQSLGCPRSQASAKLSPEMLAKVERVLAGRTFDVFENAPIDEVIKYMAATYPDRPRVVVGDSLQTICSSGSLNVSNPRERIDTVIRDVKTTQLSHPALVILTTELNRNAYRNRDQAENIDPMAAGKESGGIEYGAGMFLVLRSEEGGVVSVEIPKCKFGTKKPFKLRLDFTTMRFAEVPEAIVTDKLALAMAGFVRCLTRARDDGGKVLGFEDLKAAARADGVTFANGEARTIIAMGERAGLIERYKKQYTVPYSTPPLDPVSEAEYRAKRQGFTEAAKQVGRARR